MSGQMYLFQASLFICHVKHFCEIKEWNENAIRQLLSKSLETRFEDKAAHS